MRTLIVIKYVFAVIGLAMLVGAIWSFTSTREFLATAVTTEGVVTEMVRSRSSDSTTYSPVVEFTTESGELIEHSSTSGSNPPSYDVGEKVTVYYQPGQPHRAKISGFFSLWGLATIFGIMGSVFFFIGGGWIAYGWHRAKEVDSLKRTGTPILAEIQSVQPNTSLTVNGRNPYQITAQWLSPYDNKVYVFNSENLWFDPRSYIDREHVTVFIEQDDPDTHFMDTSFLPELGD